MRKVIRNGKVAVLYSPGYGAGWSSRLDSRGGSNACLFDPDIVALVEADASGAEIEELAKSKWPDGYFGGASDLTIEWIDEGTLFRIKEYDGYESIEYNYDAEWSMT